MPNHIDQAIAELIEINGLRPVLEALRDVCKLVADGDEEPHDDDVDEDYDVAKDGLNVIIDDLG